MAIRNIKELINNKGYVIKPEDRKIFEQEDLQSFFGLSKTDAIEFIIYDVNDNQLPQLDGSLVRYINLTDENIRDYFLIAEGTLLQKYSLPSEYFIDVERLLNEAGYSNGIFKTQITLINKRAGSEKEFDKLWIQEISPSRTEVRLFPLKKGLELNSELQQRYNILTNGYDFREDTLQAAFEIIDQINAFDISLFIKDKYGERWLTTFIDEFKIKDIQKFYTEIHTLFVKSAGYEFTNRNSKVGEIGYGDKKVIPPSLDLSKAEILNIILRILAESIKYYLPQRDIKTKSQTAEQFYPSEDTVSQILQKRTSDTVIRPATVEIIEKEITKTATNSVLENLIREEFKIQEESNEFFEYPVDTVFCTDPRAVNYGQPGLCIFPKEKPNLPPEISNDPFAGPDALQPKPRNLTSEPIDVPENGLSNSTSTVQYRVVDDFTGQSVPKGQNAGTIPGGGGIRQERIVEEFGEAVFQEKITEQQR